MAGAASIALGSIDPALQLILLMGSMTLLPFMLAGMTSFMRYAIVFSILKQAMGTQQVPPAVILVGLALVLTLYTMGPVFGEIYTVVDPMLKNPKANILEILDEGSVPLKNFMLRQTRQEDVKIFLEMSREKPPTSPKELEIWEVAPAYMLSELRTSFEIGFVIFVPFVIVDLVVSNILMALGMMMLSPTIISLPFKILIFVAVDGWGLLVRGLVRSFN
ncbi:MAG: flagellar type III secretion system pore protein FliP [Candidatus Melainabacteria bacterium]|jgi:flagellar biosynthetic protein FliP|nr:flagellar type III secretion system pore protein FliP [Candidatus Melainabacteria bacterium]